MQIHATLSNDLLMQDDMNQGTLAIAGTLSSYPTFLLAHHVKQYNLAKAAIS
jgi:hypothetical protein